MLWPKSKRTHKRKKKIGKQTKKIKTKKKNKPRKSEAISKKKNSLIRKREVPGKPTVTKQAHIAKNPSRGASKATDRISVKSRVPHRRLMHSTKKNSVAVVKLWATTSRAAANCSSVVLQAKDKASQFISKTVVSATMRFRSRCAHNREVTSIIANKQRPAKQNKASGCACGANWAMPKAPNFTIKPLNKIENSTEASTCAFKSHEKHGHRGTFTPKPQKKRKL